MNIMKTNVSRSESFRRLGLGLFILAIFFTNPSLPAWLTLIALFSLATSLVQWDPMNAVFDSVIRAINLRRIKLAAEKIAVRPATVNS